jgi:O-antigen/teichoic acid export membrane protein
MPDEPIQAPTTLVGHLRSRFASAFWSAIATALPRAALLLAGLYVARTLGADAFAQYSLAAVTMALGGGMFAMALMNLGTKRVPELAHAHNGREGAGFASLLALGSAIAIALGLGVFALAPTAASLFGLGQSFVGMLRIAACIVGAVVLHGSINGLVLGSARFTTAALSTMAGAAAFAVALVPLTAIFGISGALIAIGMLYTVTAVAEIWSIRHALSIDVAAAKSTKSRPPWQPTAWFLAPMLLYIAMFPIVVWLVNALLVHGPMPFANVARFNAAYNWFAVAIFVPGVLAQVEFVHFSRAKARGEGAKLAHMLRFSILQNLAIMVVIAGLGAVLAGPLMNLFQVGGDDGVLCLRLMFVAAFFVSLGVPTGLLFTVIDRIWFATALNAGWALVTLAVAWLLRDSGAVGVGVAFAFGYAVHFACSFGLVTRMARSHNRNRINRKEKGAGGPL